MKGMVDSMRTWLGGVAVIALVAAGGWSAGHRVSGTEIDTAAPSPGVLEQSGHPAGGTLDAEEEQRRQQEAHAWLMAERPDGADERPLTVKLTAEERAELREPRGSSRKLRIGTVKPLNVRVRFDDLRPSDLRGRQARNNGVLEGTADGGFVWTTLIRSEGATSLRVRVDAFFLPPQAELWFYTAAGEAYGPYTWAGPRGTREFWTESVSGSEAFLQLRKRGPVTPRDLKVINFIIADVGHIDESLASGGPDADASAIVSGFCPVNASCVVSGECVGPEWNNVRNAVAHIRFVSGAFIYMCSGGLIADSVSETNVPYFLTVNHCISKSGEASSMEAYFRYRASSSACGPQGSCPSPSTFPKTSGSNILSTNTTSDYTLLRLSQEAPEGSYFLGWNATAVANSNDTQLFRFSHPKGAPQAYSAHVVDTSRPTCRSWPRGPWIYSSDVTGATEGGSSGSPVVNGSLQIVGQLSGACGYNVNDSCDSVQNATVDGAFANYYSAVASYLGPGSTNQSPTASFTFSCSDLTCQFDGTGSGDSDGSLVGYSWTFGDTGTASGANVQHTYAADGIYTVTLTVTDDDGATGTSSQPVTVSSSEPTTGITLKANGYKVRGLQKADLEWSGTTANVDIYRDNGPIETDVDGPTYTDHINQRGGGSYMYQVCETGAKTNCSPTVTVTF